MVRIEYGERSWRICSRGGALTARSDVRVRPSNFQVNAEVFSARRDLAVKSPSFVVICHDKLQTQSVLRLPAESAAPMAFEKTCAAVLGRARPQPIGPDSRTSSPLCGSSTECRERSRPMQ